MSISRGPKVKPENFLYFVVFLVIFSCGCVGFLRLLCWEIFHQEISLMLCYMITKVLGLIIQKISSQSHHIPEFWRAHWQAWQISQSDALSVFLLNMPAAWWMNPTLTGIKIRSQPLPYANWSLSCPPAAAGTPAGAATWLKNGHIFDHTCNRIPNEHSDWCCVAC